MEKITASLRKRSPSAASLDSPPSKAAKSAPKSSAPASAAQTPAPATPAPATPASAPAPATPAPATPMTPASAAPSTPATVPFSSPVQPQTQAWWEHPCTPKIRPTVPNTDTQILTPIGSFPCCNGYCELMRICMRCMTPEGIDPLLLLGHPNSAKGTCQVCRQVVIAATHQCPGKQSEINRKLEY